MVESQPSSQPPSIKNYKIIGVISERPFSHVLLIQGSDPEIPLALKIINVDSDPRELKKHVASLELKNPNILPTVDTFFYGSSLCIVTSFFYYGSCRSILSNYFPKGFRDERLVSAVLRSVVEALCYMHRNNKFHRDIKASNILINRDGTVALREFGSSASMLEEGVRLSGHKTVVGTPCWIASEILDPFKGYDTQTDIWSLGITALELFFGEPPLAGMKSTARILAKVAQDDPPTIDSYGPEAYGCSEDFRKFVEVCLQKNPMSRFSAEELRRLRFLRGADTSKQAVKEAMRKAEKVKVVEDGEAVKRVFERVRSSDDSGKCTEDMWEFETG